MLPLLKHRSDPARCSLILSQLFQLLFGQRIQNLNGKLFPCHTGIVRTALVIPFGYSGSKGTTLHHLVNGILYVPAVLSSLTVGYIPFDGSNNTICNSEEFPRHILLTGVHVGITNTN